ncbi:hypothetical protein ABI_25800 [Asticcacaulis biprosthecium C19]|uniref:DUF1152 domain-containing protein n=1 Tax=Asticcacaulis biprosthecium C19 TaxID=715226 RepID=F4QPA8_9CAUL|nr:DUF1152 domain-containing protein [Asticcacaulis biprosthecium]EGF91166.1 hypothetical protein ABI_25800 [Asticcacaulis biprosthecium C19]
MILPLSELFQPERRVLIAGAGGGFDVYCGLPLALSIVAAGGFVVLGNLSFTRVAQCGGERISDAAWRVDRQAAELPYFPEKWLCEWLGRQGLELPVYAFDRVGVAPIADAYRAVITTHAIDRVVLVDGGTDSLIFGDEPGLGTVCEDAVSLVAADIATGGQAILAAIGFGIDHFHGVSHHSFLENVSRMIRRNGFLGSFSLPTDTRESRALLDLIEYANQRQPLHMSIVVNSLAAALRGEFGDYHTTSRTTGTELFINPLMLQLWCFRVHAVVREMIYGDALRDTKTAHEAQAVIDAHREEVSVRPRRPVPL